MGVPLRRSMFVLGLALCLVVADVGPGGAGVVMAQQEASASELRKRSHVAPLESDPAGLVTGAIPAGDFRPLVVERGVEPQPAPERTIPSEFEGFDSRRSRVVERDEFSQVYTNPDGSRTTELSSAPLNVRRSDGTWVEVSTDVVGRSGGGAAVEDHPLSPEFAASADDPTLMSVRRGALSLTVSLDGASASPAVRSGSTVRYADVFPGIDLVYQVEPGA